MKLQFQVTNRRGSVLAAFTHENDAERWARDHAAVTFQTPMEVFSVRNMAQRVKLPNGRITGALVSEFVSKSVTDVPGVLP